MRTIRSTLVTLAILATAARGTFAQEPQITEARAALDHGDADAAITLLEKTVGQFPENARAWFQLGNAYLGKGEASGMLGGPKWAQKGLEAFEKSVALDSGFVDARYTLVRIYAMAPQFAGGSKTKALEYARAIRAIDPVTGHRALAFIDVQENKPELARQEYLDGIRESPKSAKAHSFFGQYLLTTEKSYAMAREEFRAALAVDPGYVAALYHLGRTAALSDSDLTGGEVALKKYLAGVPKENEPTLASARYWLGMVYEKEGKKPEARRSYEDALKINPTMKDAQEALKRVP